jgi:hypothetical protein
MDQCAILPEEHGVYHKLDENGKLECTGFRPERIQEKTVEDTFGLDPCEECYE